MKSQFEKLILDHPRNNTLCTTVGARVFCHKASGSGLSNLGQLFWGHAVVINIFISPLVCSKGPELRLPWEKIQLIVFPEVLNLFKSNLL